VETWDAIRSRRNVRAYGQQAIAPQDLDRILEAARRTPSAGNQQAWGFVVCTDPQQLTQLARVGPTGGHVASSAATIALVAPTSDDARTRDLVQFDLGQATMSLMLAAADLGIGSAHAGVGSGAVGVCHPAVSLVGIDVAAVGAYAGWSPNCCEPAWRWAPGTPG
jgi:nitroreductase